MILSQSILSQLQGLRLSFGGILGHAYISSSIMHSSKESPEWVDPLISWCMLEAEQYVIVMDRVVRQKEYYRYGLQNCVVLCLLLG